MTATALYATRPELYADARCMPLIDGCADAVLMLEVIEHVRDPVRALGEAARILRPGGRLILTAPFLYPIHDAPHDYQRYTAHGLAHALAACGFRVEHLAPRLRDIETAGLLVSLAFADCARQILERMRWAAPVLPLLAIGVLASNLGTWLLARVLPGSRSMPAGYEVTAVRADGEAGPERLSGQAVPT